MHNHPPVCQKLWHGCFILLFITGSYANAQSWHAIRGGNMRNNLSPQYGLKDTQTPLWVVNDAAFTGFGGNIYTFGDRFVATRWNLSTGKSIVECRSLHTGELIWISPDFESTSKLHVTAFNEDAVYVHDYDDNIRMYHALDPATGQVKWSHPSYTFGPQDSPIFDKYRNPIINTSLDEFKKCGCNSFFLSEVNQEDVASNDLQLSISALRQHASIKQQLLYFFNYT